MPVGKFSIGKVDEYWEEGSITWNTQPSTSRYKTINEDGTDVTSDGFLHVDVSNMVRPWIKAAEPNYGLVIQGEGNDARGSFHATNEDEPYLDARIRLGFTNPNTPPGKTEVDLGHIKAGSVISLKYVGMQKPNNGAATNKTGKNISQDQYSTQNSSSGTPQGYPVSFVNNASCGGKKVEGSLQFKEDNPDDKLTIDLQPESIELVEGDTVSFNPVLEFANGARWSFPDIQLFNAGILEGVDYGRFWDPKHGMTGEFLTEVYQGFEFIATDSLPADTLEVVTKVGVLAELGNTRVDGGVPTSITGTAENSINVENTNVDAQQNSPMIVRGTADLLIRKEDLSLSMDIPGSNELWPTLRDKLGENDEGRNIKKDIVTNLTRSGEPVTNHPMTITAIRVEGSGGHNHEVDGEKLPQDRVATFKHEGEASSGKLEARTDPNGALEFDYTSSMVSGTYILQAAAQVDGDSLFARDTLVVRVPDLVPLGEDTSYVLSGGTCSHHGPERPGNPIPERCETPDNNHFITKAAKDSLVAASEEYLAAPWNTEEEKIRVNDISLPLGGYFGINSDWIGDHVSHRIGKDVDIENSSQVQRLKKVFERNGWDFIPHDGSGFYPHFRHED